MNPLISSGTAKITSARSPIIPAGTRAGARFCGPSSLTSARSVRDHLNQSAEIEDAVLINTHVARIEVQSERNSASMPSDFARRIRRSTGTLEGWITYDL
jgi:hypothetical protein